MAPTFVKKEVLPCEMFGGCVYAGRVRVSRERRTMGICTASRDKYRENPPCPTWSDGRKWKDTVEVSVLKKRER